MTNGVKPTPAVTYALMKQGNLFNLLGLVCFKCDRIAEETCAWFINDFRKPPKERQKLLAGGHLRPLGLQIGNSVFTFCLDKPWITSVSDRNTSLESPVTQLLTSLLKNI